jgi:hypothetical protein
MKKDTKNRVFHLNQFGHGDTNPILLRVSLFVEFTKIDFGYTTTDIYDNGGWIKIASDTFIEIIETGKRYTLQLAENIPIAPVQHYFESQKDWRYYSLFFPPIPMHDCSINIIEVENGTPNDFNYYGIKLRMEDGVEILE